MRYIAAIFVLFGASVSARAQMIPDNVGQSSNGLPPGSGQCGI